jgi:hypothetical protein
MFYNVQNSCYKRVGYCCMYKLGGGGPVSTRQLGSRRIDGHETSVNDNLLSVYISAGGGSQVYNRPSHFNVAIIKVNQTCPGQRTLLLTSPPSWQGSAQCPSQFCLQGRLKESSLMRMVQAQWRSRGLEYSSMQTRLPSSWSDAIELPWSYCTRTKPVVIRCSPAINSNGKGVHDLEQP